MIPAREAKEGDRYGVIRCSVEVLEALFADGHEVHARVTHGLPPGARIVGARVADQPGVIELLVSGIEPGEHDIAHERLICGVATLPGGSHA